MLALHLGSGSARSIELARVFRNLYDKIGKDSVLEHVGQALLDKIDGTEGDRGRGRGGDRARAARGT